MKRFIQSFSYIFHPLWMPLIGVSLYFLITPRYINPPFLYAKLFAVIIMTIIIPILSYFMFKNLRLVESIHLKTVKERHFPLLFQIAFTLLLIQIVFEGYEFPEIHFFFVGILGSAVASLILLYANFKTSLHMIGVSGVLLFVIGLSIHFNKNLLPLIAFFSIACGAAATSRLDAKAHTYTELIVGFFVGTIPQLLVFQYWL